jgi:hypothetical protein
MNSPNPASADQELILVENGGLSYMRGKNMGRLVAHRMFVRRPGSSMNLTVGPNN